MKHMKPIRSVYNYGTFYGVRMYDWSVMQTVWFDGKKMSGLHINDAILFARQSTAERYAKKFKGEVAHVSQTLVGRCCPKRHRETIPDESGK